MMKYKWLLSALLSLWLAGLPLAPGAQASAPAAQNTVRYSFRGQFVDAYFDSWDASGCISTSTWVSAVNGRVKQAGRPEQDSTAYVSIWQYNYCTSAQIAADGRATLPAGALQMDPNLDSAALNTTVQMYDYVSGSSFPVQVSLNWTGTGEVSSGKSNSHYDGPGFKGHYRYDGAYRDAAALGSVGDGFTNFTPDPAGWASLSSVRWGSVDITR